MWVTAQWRRLHNEELYDLYFSQNIIWVIKSRRMRWVGHVAHKGGKKKGAFRVLVERPEGKRRLWKGSDIDGRIILKWIFRK